MINRKKTGDKIQYITLQKTCAITHLFLADFSLLLSMKADANRKYTKLDNIAFILFVLLLSYLVNFTACFFV